ncbi:MAG TPA: hypothetical protein VL326_24180 [Kofleriaceae bacterium]|jgi:hypothetical protein|nr:hypothetical protein [Kofleriaceae bacterium]
MSKETPAMKTETLSRTTTDRVPGFVPGVTHLALDVADRGQSTVIAVLQDARVEIRTLVDNGIELAEKSAAGLFRFARKLTQRVDEGVGETLTSTERLLGGAVKSARETAFAAQDTATTAIAGVTGPTAKA